MSINKSGVKYEIRAVGKLIAYVSSYKLAKLIAGLYIMFSNSEKVYIDEVFPWDDSFKNQTHISIFNSHFCNFSKSRGNPSFLRYYLPQWRNYFDLRKPVV